ncbi:MAG: NUDIX domain-containing protein [Pannonibacter sp.]
MHSLLSFLPARLTRRLIHGAALLRHAHTLGVRVLVRDASGYVLLVRHTYLPGWYFPGGGVDVGETLSEAARREIFEETGITARSEPVLLGLYHNRETTRRDHVALFEIAEWTPPSRSPVPNAEIAEARFFSPLALPADVTSATRRRLDEIAGHLAPSAIW